jgi:hypothetical protein
MSDYSSYTERDTFNEALCNLVEDFLQDKDAYPADTVLAINEKTMEIELGVQANFIKGWNTYAIQSLIRNNEDNSGQEADIDATHELASSYFFVR